MLRAILPLLFCTTILCAQAPPTIPGQPPQPQQPPIPSNRPLWRVNLPGGTYELLVSAILGVSSHEYVIDGAARVTEVNVESTGQLAVRFYFLEPAVVAGPAGIGAATIGKVQSLITEAGERSGTDAWKKVVKSYPTTTHQRTVEYRIGSKDSLTKIMNSASKCIRTGKSDEISISD